MFRSSRHNDPQRGAALRTARAFVVRRTVLLDGPDDGGIVQAAGARSIVSKPSARETYDVVIAGARRIAELARFVAPRGVFVCLAHDDDAARRLSASFSVVQRVDHALLGTNDDRWRTPRLHLGCGPLALEGWINIDNRPYEGVDLLWDLANGIPLRNASLVFAEHFLEHLSYAEASRFVAGCRAALRDDGVLRLSTPNLDWVWTIAYRPHAWQSSAEAQRDCFVANRAFRAWGHQFLYNAQTLTALLRNSGFAEITFHQYGESDRPELRDLERHPRDPDDPSLPHVLIVQARGRRETNEVEGEQLIADYLRDLSAS
ncbi:MAG TPA: hypothetical protein VHW00_00140 [Thermoanaerobaculia bacterium]|nr:hypothetical protein [Thermoanaerobaculia bacterium]